MTGKRIILFFLFLFLMGIALYFLTDRPEDLMDPAGFLPEDTVALIDINNLPEKYRTFSRTRLGRQIDSINWPEVLSALGYSGKQIRELTDHLAEMRAFADSPLFREIFGRRVIAAILPTRIRLEQAEAAAGLRESFVLIARPRHRAALLNIFSSPFVREYQATPQTHQGREIRSYALNAATTVFLTVSDGYIVAALSPEPVRDCLDMSMKNLLMGNSGLKTDPEFAALRQRLRGKDEDFLYVNFRGLQSPASGKSSGTDRLTVSPEILPEEEFPFRSFVFYRRPGLPGLKKVRYAGVLRFAPESRMAGRTSRLVPPPVVNSLFEEIPADLLAFFWTNMFDPDNVLLGLQTAKSGRNEKIVGNFEEWLFIKGGITLDAFLSLFGSQVSMNVSRVREGGFLPIPRLCFRIEVKNPRKVEQVLHNLTDGMSVHSLPVNGTRVSSVQLAGGLIQPSFALHGKFLLFADSREQIELMLGGREELLHRDPLFKKVDAGLAEPNNMTAFVRNAEFIETVKELAVWSGMLMAMGDQHLGGRSKVIINQVVLPVLEGLKMFRAGSARIFSGGEELILESTLLLDENEKW
jgi:hypothetical protein